MAHVVPSSTKSCTATMWGWSIPATTRASATKRSRTEASAPNAVGSTLMATGRSRARWRPRMTTPHVPRPSSGPSW